MNTCPECKGTGKYVSPMTGEESPCSLGCKPGVLMSATARFGGALEREAVVADIQYQDSLPYSQFSAEDNKTLDYLMTPCKRNDLAACQAVMKAVTTPTSGSII